MSGLVRRKNQVLQEPNKLQVDVVAAVSATSTFMLGTIFRDYYIEYFELEAPGGYSADASNYYVITLQAGSTVLATWSTQTGQQGALTDQVMAQAVLSGSAAGSANDQLKVVCTKHASAANL